MTDCFIIGQDLPLHHVLRVSQISKAKPWPDAKKPFLTDPMIHRNIFPNNLYSLSANLDEERLKKLLNTDLSGIIDSNALDESIVNFIHQHSHNAKINFLTPNFSKLTVAVAFAPSPITIKIVPIP